MRRKVVLDMWRALLLRLADFLGDSSTERNMISRLAGVLTVLFAPAFPFLCFKCVALKQFLSLNCWYMRCILLSKHNNV